MSLSGRRWRWEAVPAPRDGEEESPAPFLRWFEFTFLLEDDPEQVARVRAGVQPADWSEETIRRILRSVRSRTWRDDEGRLWTVRLEGWSGRGISTEVADVGEDVGPEVVFAREGEGEEVRRSGALVESLTDPPEGGLRSVLEEDG